MKSAEVVVIHSPSKTLRTLRDDLMDFNSLCAPTRAFLEARGLEHIRELGKEGTKALLAHLRERKRLLVS